eukprot:UN24090
MMAYRGCSLEFPPHFHQSNTNSPFMWLSLGISTLDEGRITLNGGTPMPKASGERLSNEPIDGEA